MKLILLITSDNESGMEVANRWQEAGAPGVTIIKSIGLRRLKEKIQREKFEVPLHIASSMNSVMAYVLHDIGHTNHVLLSVVPEDLIPAMLDEAQAVLGDLLERDRGVVFVVPLDEAIGVHMYDNPGND